MTVLDSTPRDQYTASGGQTVFTYTFEIAAAGDIKVLQNGTLINQGAGAGEYAVSGVGVDTGGNVTLVTGATAGDILTIYRDMALERLTAYTNAGDFLAADVNNDFDRLWLALQQNGGDLDGRVLIAPNTDPTGIDMTIPDKATRLDKYLKFNVTTGNPEVADPTALFTSAGLNHYNFTGDGTTVNFTLGMEPGVENNTQVYIDGVYQQKNTYNVSGAIVQFSAAPPSLSTIEVMVIEVLPIGSTTASQVSFTQAGSTYGRNVQLKLQESVSPFDFGAVGDGNTTDDSAAIRACFLAAVTQDVTCNWTGAFRIDSTIVMDSTYSGLKTIGTMTLNIYGNTTSNTAAIIYPTTGSTYQVGTPADNTNLDTLIIDGSNLTSTAFTTGLAVQGGAGNTINNVTAHNFLKSGVLLASISPNTVGIRVNQITTYSNSSVAGTAGQGYAVSAYNDEDNISIGTAITYSNQIHGFDYSVGFSTTERIFAYGNGDNSGGNGGGGGKFAGTGINRTIIGTLIARGNDGFGFVTNGAQHYIGIDMVDVSGNTTNGVHVANAGVYDFKTLRCENNTNNGILVAAGNVSIGTFLANNNGANGASVSLVGNLSIDVAVTSNHTAGAGVIGSGTRSVNIRKSSSDEDVNGGVRLVGASSEFRVGEVYVTATAAYPGVYINPNPVGAIVGKITTAGSAIELTNLSSTTKREGVSGLASGATNYRSVETAITAHVGGGQANAYSATAEVSVVSVVGTTADSIKLLTAVSGLEMTIINNGANACNVFPNTSDNLGAGVNTAVSLAAGSKITYIAIDATNWE